MSDLISRQAAIKYLMDNMNWYNEDGYESDEDYKRVCITELINGVPSAQPTAEPVRHGKWIDRTIKVSAELTNIIHVCSVCEEMAVGKYRYCPHCGARMDEEWTE